MSVYVSDFTSATEWQVLHDELGHGGTIDPATVTYVTGVDGQHDHNFASVTCPVCGAQSTHPVGGGAQPESVQQMFVNKCQAEGCPCGQIEAADPNGLGESHVRLQVNRMDGAGRWALG